MPPDDEEAEIVNRSLAQLPLEDQAAAFLRELMSLSADSRRPTYRKKQALCMTAFSNVEAQVQRPRDGELPHVSV
jgi:hypothetical protein